MICRRIFPGALFAGFPEAEMSLFRAPAFLMLGDTRKEYSVMASNYAVDGDEITFIKRLLIEIYPNASFSMVSDTYDLFNLIDNLLPQCRKEIMDHNGKLIIRPDSGDIVDIAVQTVEHLYKLFPGKWNSKGYKTLDPHI